jgi:dihydroneopterin triphosphate diphosphatase
MDPRRPLPNGHGTRERAYVGPRRRMAPRPDVAAARHVEQRRRVRVRRGGRPAAGERCRPRGGRLGTNERRGRHATRLGVGCSSVVSTLRRCCCFHHWEPKLLMMRRIRSRGGFWQGITGAPLPHERDDEAAIREVQEETGFDVTRELIRLGVEYEYAITPAVGRSRGYHPETRAIHVASFAAEITRDLDPILDPNEHDEFVWCSYEQAHALLDWPTERDALEGRRRALRMIASVLGDST